MEQVTWLSILSVVVTGIGTVVSTLWKKMSSCEEEHASCRVKVAKLEEQNAQQAEQIEENNRQNEANDKKIKALARVVKLRRHPRDTSEEIPDDLESK